MAISNQYFELTSDASTLVSSRHIPTKEHVGVWMRRIDNAEWDRLAGENFDLINNAVVPNTAILASVYDRIEVRVVDTVDDLEESPTQIAVVAENIVNVNTVADNMAEVLEADTHAATATAQANISTTKANESSNSAAAALASENQASNHLSAIETIYDNFDDRYLGSFATEPTLDNDGNTLQIGAMYFDTNVDNTKFYNGTSWEDPEATATQGAATATAQAGIATTKAGEASTSASNALTSETNAANSAATAASYVPSQTGNNGKYLTTDGSINYWAEVVGAEHYDQETAPSAQAYGATWRRTSTGTIYKWVNDSGNGVWIDISTAGAGVSQEYVDNADSVLQNNIDTKADTTYVNNKPSGFKNYIINGGFDVWQDGESFSGASFHYTVDNWMSWNSTEIELVEDVNEGNTIRLSGAGADKGILGTPLELNILGKNSQFQTGKTFTVSIRYKSTSRIKPSLNFRDAVVGANPVNPTDTIFSYGGGNNIFETVSFTFDIDNNCNATNNCLVLVIKAEDAVQVDIAQVQLEEGSVATPFEQRPYGLELSLCQRYYHKTYRPNDAPGTVTTLGMLEARREGNLGTSISPYVFPVKMRTIPSVFVYSPNDGALGYIYTTNPAGNYPAALNRYTTEKGFNFGTTSNIVNQGGFVQGQYVFDARL